MYIKMVNLFIVFPYLPVLIFIILWSVLALPFCFSVEHVTKTDPLYV